MASEFDNLNPEQLHDLAQECGLVNGRADPMVIPRARSMRTRMQYARAAFIGDVRVPLLVFVVLLGMFFSGWFVAQTYYLAMVDARAQQARAQAYLDLQTRMLRISSRIRDDPEENEAYRRVSDEMRRLVVEATIMDVPPEDREKYLEREGYIERQLEYNEKREAERRENSDDE